MYRTYSTERSRKVAKRIPKPKKNALVEYLDSLRPGAAGRVAPVEIAVSVPRVVHERAEINRNTYYREDVWRVQGTSRIPIDQDCPQSFPLRQKLDYIRARRNFARERESLQERVPRPCHALEGERRIQLRFKHANVEKLREDERCRGEKWRELRARAATEMRMAELHDRDARLMSAVQSRERSNAGTQCESQRSVKSKPQQRRVIKPAVYEPYALLEVPVEPEPVLPDYNSIGSNNNLTTLKSSQPKHTVCFLKVDPELPPESLVNISSLVASLISNKPRSAPSAGPRQIVVVAPRTFRFGDSVPRQVTQTSYRDSFNFYRLDPDRLADRLRGMDIDPAGSVPIDQLRRALTALAKPIEDPVETLRYGEILGKHRALLKPKLEVTAALRKRSEDPRRKEAETEVIADGSVSQHPDVQEKENAKLQVSHGIVAGSPRTKDVASPPSEPENDVREAKEENYDRVDISLVSRNNSLPKQPSKSSGKVVPDAGIKLDFAPATTKGTFAGKSERGSPASGRHRSLSRMNSARFGATLTRQKSLGGSTKRTVRTRPTDLVPGSDKIIAPAENMLPSSTATRADSPPLRKSSTLREAEMFKFINPASLQRSPSQKVLLPGGILPVQQPSVTAGSLKDQMAAPLIRLARRTRRSNLADLPLIIGTGYDIPATGKDSAGNPLQTPAVALLDPAAKKVRHRVSN